MNKKAKTGRDYECVNGMTGNTTKKGVNKLREESISQSLLFPFGVHNENEVHLHTSKQKKDVILRI